MAHRPGVQMQIILSIAFALVIVYLVAYLLEEIAYMFGDCE